VFVPGRAFQRSPTCVGKTESLPQSGTPEMHFAQVGFGLRRKHQTRLERSARNQHSSLLDPFVS